MKLKYDFVINNVAGSSVAVPVGSGSENFNGYIKLNDTGDFIFKKILNEKADREDIIAAILTEFSDVTEAEAAAAVDGFVGELKRSGVLCDE